MDPQPRPPEWLLKPAIPQPSAKRDFLPGPSLGGAQPGGGPSSPEMKVSSTEIEDDEPVDWDIGDVGDFKPKQKPEAPANAGRGRTPSAWFSRTLTSFAVFLLLILIGWLVRLVWSSHDRQTSTPLFETPEEGREDWHKLAPALAERFANADSAEDWISMVRDPERVAPLIRAFKPRFAVGRPLGIKAFGSEPFGSDELYQFSVTYEDGRSRLIHILPTPDGPKVDWEAFARSGGADFGQLSAPAVVEAELRVLVRRARYYNYNFADDRRWRAYEILNGDWPEPFTGYTQIGSLADEALARIIAPGLDASPVRVILKVRTGGDDGARGQLEILEFVQQGWVKP